VPTPSRGPFSFYCTSQHNCREREELNIKLKPKWSIVKAMDIKPQEQVFQLWSGERDALESDSTYPDGTVPFKDTVYLLNTAQTKLDNLGSVSVVDLPLGSRKNDINIDCLTSFKCPRTSYKTDHPSLTRRCSKYRYGKLAKEPVH
jgi:hypothetical protein